MRRSTRVFGVVMKGSDSGRVLRSGRRLLPEQSVEAKTKRGNEGEDWPPPPKNNSKKSVVLAETAPEEERKRGRDSDGVDRLYGIVYRRKRRRTVSASSLVLSRRKVKEVVDRSVFSVVVTTCAGKSGRFSSLLVSVLRYMMRVTVKLPELLAFFLSEPIHAAFASQGVQFLQVYCCFAFCYLFMFNILDLLN